MRQRTLRQMSTAGTVIILVGLATGTAVLGQVQKEHEEAKGLAALMQVNRQHFEAMVQTAYFEGAERRLQSSDYQNIRQQAQAIAGIARQVQQDYSRGERFEEIAGDLQEHAEEGAKAAPREDLPEINVQIGEMAEYCAKCHQEFRW